jgi:UDP-glucose 4-epimerase
MASKILILGGAGFLGANLIRRCLAENGARITVLDSLDPRFQSSMRNLEEIKNKIHFVRGDLRDEKLLAEIIPGQDIIFQLAAQSSHTLSLLDPISCAEINLLGNLKFLEAVRLFNPEAAVVYTSSSTAVGNITEPVADEAYRENPLGIYSAHKGSAEKYYSIYARLHGLKTVTLRFANLYGAFGKNSPDFGFINYFISRASADKSITVFGAGEQLRNITYAEDACDILWRAAEIAPQNPGEVFFATSPFHLSVKEIAETIVRVFERGRIEHVEWPEQRKKIEVEDAVFSSQKIRGATGWQARYDFETGLRKTRYLLESQQLDTEASANIL